MTDPSKPRRKVASQISFTAPTATTSSPSPSLSTPSSTVPARLKARVDPSSIASSSSSSTASTPFARARESPSTPTFTHSRPTPRSTPSTLSLRSAPPSSSLARARSPVPPSSAGYTPTPTSSSSVVGHSNGSAAPRTNRPRTPGTPSLVTRPSFQREQSDRDRDRGTPTGTGNRTPVQPVARIRAARSVIDSPTSSASANANVTTRTPRTPDLRRGHSGVGNGIGASASAVGGNGNGSGTHTPSANAGAGFGAGRTDEQRSRARALSLRSNSGEAKAVLAKVRSPTSIPDSTPTPATNSLRPVPSILPTPAEQSHPKSQSPSHSHTPSHSQPHIPRYTGGSPTIQTPPPQPITSTVSPNHPYAHVTSSLIGSSLLSPALGMDDGGIRALTSTWRDSSPERISDNESHLEVSSNRSSPTRRSPQVSAVTSAQHALAYIFQHPAASAPTSPVPLFSPSLAPEMGHGDRPRSGQRSSTGGGHSRARLPYYPNVHPPSLPPPPISPELKTVALPTLTPVRSTTDSSVALSRSLTETGTTSASVSGSPSGSGSRKLSGSGSDLSGLARDVKVEVEEREREGEKDERDRLSGATAVDVTIDFRNMGDKQVEAGKEGDAEIDDVLGEDAEEAKVNRKIADLEISNASLLAINKTLETTKAKQRSEIVKLRRMLRESMGGNGIPSSFNPLSLPGGGAQGLGFGLGSPLSLLSPSMDQFSDIDGGPLEGGEEGFLDEEISNPHLDARWDKIADLVMNMKRRGENAVEKGKEEVKVGPVGRVLGWMEVEKQQRDDSRSARDSNGGGVGDGGAEGGEGDETIGDISVDSIVRAEIDEDGDGDGEDSREEVDLVI